MAPLLQILSSSLDLPRNSYIYKILSTAPRQDPLIYSNTDRLAIIASDDSLRFVDPATLNLLPDGIVKDVNTSVTCLERADDQPGNILATTGRDGMIKFWDKRNNEQAMVVESENKLLSSLVCNGSRNFVAAGVENPSDGLGVTPVYIWDQRNVGKPLLELVESHTDTITNLKIHPDLPTLLLSASTDGLVNIFDTSQSNEDDALYQVINHRSAVAHAGFMYPTTDIYVLGTDETMSFYALQSQAEEEEEPTPKVFGEVRENLGCGPFGYLAKMHWIGDEAYIAAGKHRSDPEENSSSHLDLIPIRKNLQSGPLQYEYDLEASIRLPGAHGDEIVRDVFTDVHSRTTYTCGEDSFIRAWKLPGDEAMEIDKEVERKPKKIKEKRRTGGGDSTGGKKARYNPY